MIFVDGLPLLPADFEPKGRETLTSVLGHPSIISSSDRLKASPEMKISDDHPAPGRLVYVFQREYATVDPALVQLVGTDEATTCVGLVIRGRSRGMTSVSHMDFPGVVNRGLLQMLASIADCDDTGESDFDVHLIGGFDDRPRKHPNGTAAFERQHKRLGYSLPLCSQLIEALHSSQKKFHLQTLCILEHNTRIDSRGNACPIISGFVRHKISLLDSDHPVTPQGIYSRSKTSSGSIMPASFDTKSRCPDEIVRRIRVTVSSKDPDWKGKLLETYDTRHDRFKIAPCTWVHDWRHYALSLQQLSDSDLLLRCSTSPFAESPDFVENERRKWDFLIENPDWRYIFVEQKPRIFQRSGDGGWSRCG